MSYDRVKASVQSFQFSQFCDVLLYQHKSRSITYYRQEETILTYTVIDINPWITSTIDICPAPVPSDCIKTA